MGAVASASFLLAAVLGVLAVPTDSAAASAPTCPVFNGTTIGSAYTVPAAGVSEVHLKVSGQPGQGWKTVIPGFGGAPSPGTVDVKGGLGSQMIATLPVTGGDVVQAWRLPGGIGGVGGAWMPTDAGQLAPPGPPGGNGGDAQYITVTPPGSGACAQLVILAAGGGGAGAGTNYFEEGFSHPGFGGNADAGAGATGGGDGDQNDSIDGGHGGPASATGGGYGGAAGHTLQTCRDGNAGAWGGFMSGGNGGLGHEQGTNRNCKPGFGGGGGGAGYYNGGGGGTGWDNEPSGGGGGGSSYAMSGLTSVFQGPVPIETDPGPPSIVPPIDTYLSLTSSPNPSTLDQPVTFTAVVTTPVPSVQIDVGTVSFRNGNAHIGDAPVVGGANGSGTASFVTSSLPGGTNHMSATYSGFSGGGRLIRPTVATMLDQGVTPKITFTSTPPAGAKAHGATYLVTATNSAGLDIVFSIDPTSSAVCTISGATVTFLAAGTCRIHAHQYQTATVPWEVDAQQDVTVAAATVQTITFTSTPPVGANPGDNYVVSATGGASGNPVTFTTSSADPCNYTGTATNVVQLQAGGTCRIFAHQNGGNGFAPADAQQDVLIGAVPDTILIDSQPLAEAVPGDTYQLVARTGSFNLAVISLAPESVGCTKSADFAYGQYQTGANIAFTGVGTCILKISTAGNMPRISGAQSEFRVVVKSPQEITFTSPADQPRPTYGGTYQLSGIGGGSGNPVTLTSLTPTTCTVSGGTVTFLAAAFCQIRYNQAGSATYAPAPFRLSNIFVDRAPLSITPPNVTIAYGDAVPTSVEPVITGFVAGDDEASLDGPVTCAPYGPFPGVSTYSINCQHGGHPGYKITPGSSILTIAPAPLTIGAPDVTLARGDSLPATFTPTYSGFAPGESVSSLTTAPTCTLTTVVGGVGTYPIACSGAVGPNYAFTYTPGALTVTGAPLTVTAPAASFVYGESVPSSFTPEYSGFLPGESVSSLETPGTCAPTTAVGGVGTYTIACSGAADPGYTFTYTDSALTITPAELTVTAPTVSLVYGASVPATFAPAEYTGFVALDSASSLTTPATCTPTTPVAGVGTYVIACAGAVGADYDMTYVDGSLDITPAAATVTAPTRSVTYGPAATSVSLDPSVDGLVNGDTQSTAGLASVSCSTTAVVTPGSSYPAGSFPIACTGPAATDNYTVTYLPATLTVGPAPLTITADPKSKSYGQPNPTFTVTYDGLVNHDLPAALAGTLAFSTVAGGTSGVGSYVVTPSGLSSPNYTIGYVAGTLTVTKAGSQPVLATSLSPSVYGQGVTLTATVVPTPAGAGLATGTVMFKDGATTLGTATIAGGTASLKVAFQSVAGHTLTAVYSGDANVVGGPSTPLTQVVTKAPTTLVASPAARFFPTFTVTLTRTFDGLPLAGQTVSITTNGKKKYSAITDSKGQASFRPLGAIYLVVSTYSAAYAGNGNYLPVSATGIFR